MLLKDKKGLITGVANNNSIAWAIAKAAHLHGAELAFTYQGPILEKRVAPLAQELGCNKLYQCDVTDEQTINSMFDSIKKTWGKLDFIVHAIAFSDRNELRGRFVDTTLTNFLNTMEISCYSLVSMARQAESLLQDGGSIITLTYYGAAKVIPSYNVMGVAKAALEASVRYLAADLGRKNIRVNAISAGPIKTLASSVIGDFRSMLSVHKNTAALDRNTESQDIANSAVYLLSGLASGVTGEIHYVDCGYSIMGMSTQLVNNEM